MALREGVPPEHRTLVVVPTMLSNVEAVEELLSGLEVRYLANRDHNLHFGLLTDLEDADCETAPGDEALIKLAREGIDRLNETYGDHRSDIFYLFHRARRWNAQERRWMGYERKRGKLIDLNHLLRGATDRFAFVVGDIAVLKQVRYVITLDTDTQLPRDSAREMVGTLSHLLNRAVYDPQRGRVVEGYGILQPRVGVSLPSARLSWFVRLFAADPGLDPYTRVVSDLYQDLFGEGSFIGKGIYDVDAFIQCCESYPENTILSHDLLESAYVRSALVSDVEFYEDYPSRYPADVSRRHRWIRGDWQIIGWLLPHVRDAKNERVRNPISALSWWKIFDNLRRSLVPISLLSLLLLGLLLDGPALGVVAALFVVAIVGLVPLISVLADLIAKPRDLPLWAHLRSVGGTLAKQSVQFFFAIVFLPYDAYIGVDAIARTLYRMAWSQTKLLEWKTARAAHRDASTNLPSYFQTMWIGPAIALAALFFVTLGELPIFGVLLSLWLVSPFAAWWLSRSLPVVTAKLSALQRIFLEKLTRRTWRFFEDFVTEEENWLPPDNIQEQPSRIVAPRTSPTNVGMAMLANLAAYDFGYSSVGQVIDRTRKSFDTMAKMERYRGHFFNWYDTRTLKPLHPRYVSTVDSGNLVGHLLVLRRGLLELSDAVIVPPRLFGGLLDTARILLETAQPTAKREITAIAPAILAQIERFESLLLNPPLALGNSLELLEQLLIAAKAITAAISGTGETRWWASTLERSLVDHRDDLLRIARWAALPAPPSGIWEHGSPEQIVQIRRIRHGLEKLNLSPTLREVAGLPSSLLPILDQAIADNTDPTSLEGVWLLQLRQAFIDSSRNAAERIRQIELIAGQCQEFADVDFSFLFDESRELFAIGYNAVEQKLDASFYDLLASEARLASFVLIAQGQCQQKHWFALGRLLTATGGAPTLLSWSGSMFEYLMPLLVMPTYENTLLDQTYRSVVRRQISYGRQRGVPWGISESGYNTIDAQMNYQYRAFGVPGLGLKRGLAEDLVIAPYASVMALMVAPEAACRNLERLTADGRQGDYGLYEAVDYTPSRLPRGTEGVTIRQFMAHHEGMSLLALLYLLQDKPMQRRFEADPVLNAADLLLQERIPKAAMPVFPHVAEAQQTRAVSAEEEGRMRVINDPAAAIPEVHLLSNGRYHVAVTSAGGGYSRWRDLAVTRWREDPTRDCWGTFCYIRDLDSGNFWSTSAQPTLKASRRYEAIFTQTRGRVPAPGRPH